MKLSKIIQEFRDERSMELYGKPECQLQIAERQRLNQYVRDYENPTWKNVEIDGKETNYAVSNIGTLKNRTTDKLLSLHPDKDGYLMAFILVDNKSIGKGIHRFVAMAFIPNPENKPQVNHINGIKVCNWVGNLEWVTCKENIVKAHEIGLYPSQKGDKNYNSKHSEKEIHYAISFIANHKEMTYTELSKQLGMSRTFLYNLAHGKRWGHLGININNICSTTIPKGSRV